jgi:hypothetical protein
MLMLTGAFAEDTTTTESTTLATVQKPIDIAILNNQSGPPTWKDVPLFYQISDGDHMNPSAPQEKFEKEMNVATISIKSNYASLVSHPKEIVDAIYKWQKEASNNNEK